jgi:ribonuclease HI
MKTLRKEIQNTLNVFCDASIDLNKKLACAGSVIVNSALPDYSVYNSYLIQLNATNNSAEILAIYNGIDAAIRYMYWGMHNFTCPINIFSDSKISLYGLREWIYDWIARRSINGVLYNSSGNVVANQEMFLNTARLILDNNLNINLFHQRGHLPNSQWDSNKVITAFSKENDLHGIDKSDMISICHYNDYVDKTTKSIIKYLTEYNYDIEYIRNIIRNSNCSSNIDIEMFQDSTVQKYVQYQNGTLIATLNINNRCLNLAV